MAIPEPVARRKKLKYCTSRGDLISRVNNDYFPLQVEKARRLQMGELHVHVHAPNPRPSRRRPT